MKEFKCPICGKPTSQYFGTYREDGLCREHKDMLKQNLLKKCFKCGKWYNANDICDCEKTNNENTKEAKESFCIICDEPSHGKQQCKNCYNETKEHLNGLNKNAQAFEFREHYFNLKDAIYRMWAFDKVKANCNRLIAIALLNEKVNNDKSLIDRVYKDVEYLIERKKPEDNTNNKNDEELINSKNQTDIYAEEIIRTADGHRVKSDGEKQIDEILYRIRLIHSYGNKVNKIKERAVYCDWFIPILSETKGIYIEYWGMNTPDYIKNKTDKLELYKKHKLPLIEIQKDDIKDTQSLMSSIIEEVEFLSKEHFKIELNLD